MLLQILAGQAPPLAVSSKHPWCGCLRWGRSQAVPNTYHLNYFYTLVQLHDLNEIMKGWACSGAACARNLFIGPCSSLGMLCSLSLRYVKKLELARNCALS